MSWRKVNNICTCLWLQHVRHRYSSVHSHSRDMTIREGLHRIQAHIRHKGYTHRGKRHSSSGEDKGEFALRLPSSLNSWSNYFSHCHGYCSVLLWGRQRDHCPFSQHSSCPCSGWWQPTLSWPAPPPSTGTWAPQKSGWSSPTPVTRWGSSLALIQIPLNNTESTLIPLGFLSCNLLLYQLGDFFFFFCLYNGKFLLWTQQG